MPPINKYKCNKCDFAFPEGWGGYAYRVDEKGERIPVGHPFEMRLFFKGFNYFIPGGRFKLKRKRGIDDTTGFNSHCVCLDCLRQFDLDIGDAEEAKFSWRYFYGATKRKDERKCPYCGSDNVKTVFELIGDKCPKCKEGIIEEMETGAVS